MLQPRLVYLSLPTLTIVIPEKDVCPVTFSDDSTVLSEAEGDASETSNKANLSIAHGPLTQIVGSEAQYRYLVCLLTGRNVDE